MQHAQTEGVSRFDRRRLRGGNLQSGGGLPEQRTLVTIGKQADVAHAHEPTGQYVEGKALEELLCRKLHDLAAVAVRAITVGKAHLIVLHGAQALVGDGALVGIAR